MNVIRFNEPIREAQATYPVKDVLPVVFGDWEKTPLFDYQLTAARERELIDKVDRETLFHHLPFPTFRLNLTELCDDPTGGSYKASYVVRSDSQTELGPLHVFVAVRDLWHSRKTDRCMYPCAMWIGDLRYDPRPNTEADYLFNFSFATGTTWHLDLKEHYLPHEMALTLAKGAMDALGAFVMDAQLPGTHLVSVRPAQDRRSVEWIKSRTHYTLITHGHPANKREVQHGDRVKVDHAAELTRMAHNRRMHQRTLRSERFTYARGKTIWVKATWVGPKEWRDEGGNQIYRILEPVEGAYVSPAIRTAV